MKNLGILVNEYRVINNLTIERLSSKIAVSYNIIYEIENNNYIPMVDVLQKLYALGIDISQIFNTRNSYLILESIFNNSFDEYIKYTKIDLNDYKTIYKLLPPMYIEKLYFAMKNHLSDKDLIYFIPFLKKELIEKIAHEEFEKKGIKSLSLISPFLEHKLLLYFAEKAYINEGYNSLITVAPFINKYIQEVTIKEYKQNGFENLYKMIKYINKNTINELAIIEYKKNGMKNLLPIISYIDENILKK